MGLYIKNWTLDNWKELLKWARIGANNAMIGEHTEVEEVTSHGRLIDADDIENITMVTNVDGSGYNRIYAPIIIDAEE